MQKLKITPDELTLDGKRLDFVNSISVSLAPRTCKAVIDVDIYPHLEVDAEVTVNRHLRLGSYPIEEIIEALARHPEVKQISARRMHIRDFIVKTFQIQTEHEEKSDKRSSVSDN